MTVRNVGIVFAPTLNIPAPVFSMFLTEFDLIFGDDPPGWLVERMDELKNQPPPQSQQSQSQSNSNSQSQLHPGNHGTDEIRSPRHQMFSDLPATPNPAYTSFPSSSGNKRENENSAPAVSVSVSEATTPRSEHFDTGFVSTGHHQTTFAEYASMNGMLAPNSNGGTSSGSTAGQSSSKSKRRESSLLFMGLGGGKKGSLPQIRDEGD